MIQLIVKKHCERLGITNAHQLKLALDCHAQTATQLFQETLTRVDLEVLDKMVRVFKCPVQRILAENGKGRK